MSSQKDLYGEKGSSEVSGKVVVVAVKASKEISKTALVWALTHIAQPGDCIKLLVVSPAICPNKRIWGFSRFATDCTTSHWRSHLGTTSDQKELIANSCSQMVLQLHNFYDPEKIKIRVEILSGSSCGSVAAEAKKVQSSWVILDRKLKHEKKHCMEELCCNIVIMERSRPKVLRLNLISSPNMELKAGCPLSPKLNAYPRNLKEKSEHPDASSPEQGSTLTATDIGTSPISSSDNGASPLFHYGNYDSRMRCFPFVHEGLIQSDSESENLSLSSKSSYFQPWITNAISKQQDSMLRSSDKALISTFEALLKRFSKLDQDPVSGALNCKLDVSLSRSVREAISLARNAPLGHPPLCSICQHKAPVFGNPPRWFTFAELQLATGGFSHANFLAEGGFGSVHRGVLPDGQIIAVKQYKLASTQGDIEFCSEVEILSCAQHRNVVMLIGFCVEDRRRLLVYEYICNGSLYSHLHGHKKNVLEWSARQKIAVRAARGLRYLHEECRLGCIVHRDMRPTNILLTHDFEALVGDFGLARWQPDGEMGVETRVIGTFGYLAPEYTQSGQITEKADVYSFGVVLLELVTGRKAVDINRPKGQQCLREWAHPLLKGHAFHELVDPSIRNCYLNQEVHRMLQCSSLCIQQDPHLRPPISQGVSIGPFCSVSSSVKLGNGCQLYPGSHVFGSTELGDNCILMTGAVVGDDYPGNTIIGSNNIIGYHAVIGVKCQDLKYKPGDECFLEVGDNNDIREHTSVHRSSKSTDRTVIGDSNFIMGSCHIAHDCKIGNNNIFANNTLLAGHVKVEDYVHTAGATAVHQFCHLGSFCSLGGGSVVSQDVPKYMMVAGVRAELRGLNLVGLTRRGFGVAEIRGLKAAYRKIFMSVDENAESFQERLAEEQHEELVHIPAVRAMLQSIRNSFADDRRGICKYRHWSGS